MSTRQRIPVRGCRVRPPSAIANQIRELETIAAAAPGLRLQIDMALRALRWALDIPGAPAPSRLFAPDASLLRAARRSA